ncbi:MAG: hypothetical protein WAP52_01625, partial [Candidatus Sungiibacteriota bacterium]
MAVELNPTNVIERSEPIAIFTPTQIPNQEFMRDNALRVVRHLSMCVDATISQRPDLSGEIGQILVHFSEGSVEVRQKYWDERQIIAFKNAVRALAPLHKW